jgi:predicted homoserine dehydrogenase-like protein
VAPGVFVVIRTEDPYVHHEMSYLQMGEGPYFALYRPYHLASIEAPLTVYEMVLDRRASLVTEHWNAEVAAQSKRDLKVGDTIDGIGGYTVRGLIEDAEEFAGQGHVPLGVLAGARLVRDVPVGQTLSYDDVELVEQSLVVRMRHIQEHMDDDTAETPKLVDLRASLPG